MASGTDLVTLAATRIGEKYEHVRVPKDNPQWHGPWDCAEFVAWVVYQQAGRLYGCIDNSVEPSLADAYSGAFVRDCERGVLPVVSLEEAAVMPGAILVRRAPAGGDMGHVALCDGHGGTIEAAGRQLGVRRDRMQGRQWHFAALVPGVAYTRTGRTAPSQPLPYLLQYTEPNVRSRLVGRVQKALRQQGYDPGHIDGKFGPCTLAAVYAFQKCNRLVADGVVGPATARKLGVPWPQPAVTSAPALASA